VPSLSLSKLLRVGEGRMVKRLKHIAEHVESLSPDVEGLTDEQLKAKTTEFRERYAAGETLDELLPEAFSVAREASWRVIDNVLADHLPAIPYAPGTWGPAEQEQLITAPDHWHEPVIDTGDC